MAAVLWVTPYLGGCYLGRVVLILNVCVSVSVWGGGIWTNKCLCYNFIFKTSYHVGYRKCLENQLGQTRFIVEDL